MRQAYAWGTSPACPRRTLAVDTDRPEAGKGHRSVTTQPSLVPGAFAAKWRGVTTSERAAFDEPVIDLCRILREPMRATGSRVLAVEVGFRYTPTTCFETFPFPDPTPEQRERVGEAARRLVELRDGWLNPPGLDPADLAKRTLTNLYNQRPTWLANAHADLDAAVFAAYGWPLDLMDVEILERLLALNLERAAAAIGGRRTVGSLGSAPTARPASALAAHSAARRSLNG